MLRMCTGYDPKTDRLDIRPGSLTVNQVQYGGFNDLAEELFKFARGLAKLGVDTTEVALFCAVCLVTHGELVCLVFLAGVSCVWGASSS